MQGMKLRRVEAIVQARAARARAHRRSVMVGYGARRSKLTGSSADSSSKVQSGWKSATPSAPQKTGSPSSWDVQRNHVGIQCEGQSGPSSSVGKPRQQSCLRPGAEESTISAGIPRGNLPSSPRRRPIHLEIFEFISKDMDKPKAPDSSLTKRFSECRSNQKGC